MLKTRKVVFFSIIGLAVVFIVGLLIIERLGIFTLPSRQVAKVPIQVAVPPALFDWVEASARDFNDRNADAQVTVTAVNGLSAVEQFAKADADARPQAWMPEATFVAVIAQDRGLPFETTGQSVAASDLVWGAFSSRETVLVGKFGALNWGTIHEAAASGGWGELDGDANWGYFKLTLASPTRNTEGLAALLSAAAAYHGQPNLTRDHVTDGAFLEWLQAIVTSVPNFNTLGPEPAESMATRGPSVGDVGLLTAAAWQRSQTGLNNWEGFVTATPQFTVRLDYPYLLRSDLDEAEQKMTQRFGAHLLGQAGQLADYGFDAQATVSTAQVKPEAQAVLALFHWAERERIGQ